MLLNDTIRFTGIIKLSLENKDDAKYKEIINKSDLLTSLLLKRKNMNLVDIDTVFDNTILINDYTFNTLQGIYTLNDVIDLLTNNKELSALERSRLHYYYTTLPHYYQECLLTFISNKYEVGHIKYKL